jgi:hypothetical protein
MAGKARPGLARHGEAGPGTARQARRGWARRDTACPAPSLQGNDTAGYRQLPGHNYFTRESPSMNANRLLNHRDTWRLLFGVAEGRIPAATAAVALNLSPAEFEDLRCLAVLTFPHDAYARTDPGRSPSGPHRLPCPAG